MSASEEEPRLPRWKHLRNRLWELTTVCWALVKGFNLSHHNRDP